MDIVMKGPGKNSLGTEMMGFVRESLAKAQGAPVLLTGAGDSFSAGLNLKEVAGLDAAGMQAFLTRLEETVAALYQYSGPTVALINGHAIAGGCVLALCCDWRVAVDDPKVKIGLNEVALGLRFPPRTFAVVRNRLPVTHREEVMLQAGLFDPRNAFRLGLVDEVAADAGTAARAALERLGKLPQRAYGETKRDLRGIFPQELCPDEDWKRRMAEMLPVWASPEVKERALAALGKK